MIEGDLRNGETREIPQRTTSFEEIRQKIIELNKRNKERTDNSKVGVEKSQMEQENKVDMQKMKQLVSGLKNLYYGLNEFLKNTNILYVNEENWNIVINYYEDKNEGIWNRIKSTERIIFDGEKAVLRRKGKVENQFKFRTPEDKKNHDDFNAIYDDLLYKKISCNRFWKKFSIDIQNINDGREIKIINWEAVVYSLTMINNWYFKLIDKNNSIDYLSPEDVKNALHMIQEEINNINAWNKKSYDNKIEDDERKTVDKELYNKLNDM